MIKLTFFCLLEITILEIETKSCLLFFCSKSEKNIGEDNTGQNI